MMPTRLLLLLFLIVSLHITSVNAQEQVKEGVNISVNVTDISSDEGQVLYSLHSKETWLKGPGIQNEATEIVNGQSSTVFKNVPPGTYSIMVLHDENNNNDMDTNFVGLPKEEYGSSHNPGKFGPPSFKASKFEVEDQDLTFEIKV